MQALGIIEVVGLVAGIEAADVACKTANVSLIGYELAKGGGLVTIKVTGQVGAVQASMDAAAHAAAQLSRVVSVVVIPRPHDQIDPLVHSKATVGWEPPEPATAPKPATARKSAPASPAAKNTPTPDLAAAPAPAKASTATTTTRRKSA